VTPGAAGVPTDAKAVVLNVTATTTEASGFATVWPCGQPTPDASNVNFVQGRDVSNLVISSIGAGGGVCLKASANTNLLVDVSGYFPAGSGYQPAGNPVRLLDTRSGNGAPQGIVGAGGTVQLVVANRGGVPSNASAVVLNVTAASTQEYGYVTVFPCGAMPDTSNLNFVTGQDVPNLVIAQLSPSGTVCLNTAGATHLIADLAGYFSAGTDYQPTNPTRVLDTRNGTGGTSGRVQGSIELQVSGVPAGASAVALNVTAADALADGFATVYPCGQGVPDASNLNFAAKQNIANSVIVQPGANGKVCLFASQPTHFIADVTGYFQGGYTPVAPRRLLDSRTIPAPAPPPPPPAPAVLPVGTTMIGPDSPPGRYIAAGAQDGCYWERLRGLSGESGDIIANDFRGFTGRAIVDIGANDLAFKNDADCGPFVSYRPSMAPTTIITPGDWVVGSEIVPGTYATNASDGCYWERVSSFGNTFSEILANDFIADAGPAFVTIKSADVGFKTDGECGTWYKV
jgi:hypothetical protein